jgi:O-antigen ligase
VEKASWVCGKDELRGPVFWLSAFYFVYCARPGDWNHALTSIPFAKIAGMFVALSVLLSAGKTPRRFKDLPKEAFYLLTLIALLFVSAGLSPVWKGGAFLAAADFAKVYIAWILTFLLVNTLARLKRLIFIQVISVVVVSLLAVVKGHSVPRLAGVIGGIYSAPNDFAFAIVLSLPFCLAFFVSAPNLLRKALWLLAMLVMSVTLFLTASRAGFIDLAVSGTVCLWHVGVRGRRMYLIAGTVITGIVLLATVGGRLTERFAAIEDEGRDRVAWESVEERKTLISDALDTVSDYPLLGVGMYNFPEYSNTWMEVHVSYLQIAAEGGLLSLLLYLIFFYRGFANLGRLRRDRTDDPEITLLAGALYSSLVGFVVGACFAPAAYQYFPYFAVCYTSVLLAMAKDCKHTAVSRVIFSSSGHRIVEGWGTPQTQSFHPTNLDFVRR